MLNEKPPEWTRDHFPMIEDGRWILPFWTEEAARTEAGLIMAKHKVRLRAFPAKQADGGWDIEEII